MKLQLADATIVAIKSCVSTTTVVNGSTVNAIVFTVTGQSLQTVKELFGKESNTAVIKTYTDEGKLSGTFDGYQVRKSVSITMVEDEYEVVMAQTSEVEVKVKALEKIVTDFTDVTNQLTEATEILKDNVNKIGENLRLKDSSLETQGNKLENMQQLLANQSTDIANINENVNSLNKTVGSVQIDAGEAVNAANRAVQAVTEFANVANSAHEAAASARQAALDAETKVIANTDEFRAVKEASSDSAKSAADLADAYATTTEKIKGFKESVKSAEQTAEDCKTDLNEVKTTQESQNSELESLSNRIDNLEPITDYTTLPMEQAKAFRVKESAEALAEFLAANPITSTVHDEEGAKYSITKEKQDRLAAMIAMTQMAASSGIEYQPSWNAAGEVCTYDWTLEQLSTLAFEIEATVRPLVSHQQTLEKQILAAKTIEELQAVVISYNNIVANPLPAGL